ncbi:MacS family sensor histidine kinase [Dactylosporangium cerinum]|uniref:MacS family sensor histidine kinase n=1 Tax=Dactylosporangium cerinum TaxID=1434730 RepID=A0ABV9VZG7_9ACTN
MKALEGPLWRALLVFRIAALGYAAVLMIGNFQHYHWPLGGWLVLSVMAAWTVVSSLAYARPERRDWPLLTADLAVTAGCLLATRWIVQPDGLGVGAPTLPMAWVASPVVAWAISGGRRRGAIAALLMSGADVIVRDGFSQATVNGPVLMLLAGVGIGHIARLAIDAEARLQRATELEAATRERERLARGIHDSVLQVLALLQRRGAELGGEAAELGRLAGEQEATLRALVTSSGPPPAATTRRRTASTAPQPPGRRSFRLPASLSRSPSTTQRARPATLATTAAGLRETSSADLVDLRTLLAGYGAMGVSVAAPATEVLLPAPIAAEVAAAVAAAVDNVSLHAGPDASAWLLVEELDDTVTVTIRDNGPGIPDGRLTEAERAGRLGLAQSIRGRIRDLGGTTTITSTPTTGTEIELQVPR